MFILREGLAFGDTGDLPTATYHRQHKRKRKTGSVNESPSTKRTSGSVGKCTTSSGATATSVFTPRSPAHHLHLLLWLRLGYPGGFACWPLSWRPGQSPRESPAWHGLSHARQTHHQYRPPAPEPFHVHGRGRMHTREMPIMPALACVEHISALILPAMP